MKRRKVILLTIAFIAIIFCTNGELVKASETTFLQPNYTISKIQTRADIIDWRYKIENDRLYRRLYNYTKQMWIGEWEIL